MDNTKVQQKDEVKYLGVQLNKEGDCKTKKYQNEFQMHLTHYKDYTFFFFFSNCPIKFKIIALDAIVKSKLLYGIDSLQLNEPELNKLEKNHLPAMRKIFKWDTTYINRETHKRQRYEEVNKQSKRTKRKRQRKRKEENKKKDNNIRGNLQ